MKINKEKIGYTLRVCLYFIFLFFVIFGMSFYFSKLLKYGEEAEACREEVKKYKLKEAKGP